MKDYVEKGDIYFFYRPKVNTPRVENIEDVQRLYLVLAPDDKDTARLFLVGKKRMPEISHGKPSSTAREWMMNDMRQANNHWRGASAARIRYQNPWRAGTGRSHSRWRGALRYL